MKVKDELVLKKIAGEYIVIPVGSMTVDMRCMIKLNETGAFLWEKLGSEKTREELLAAMMDEYEVDEKTAIEDIERFIERVSEAGFLHE